MSARNDLPVWRSLLYVPANVDRFVDKAHTRGADAIQLDLEDSVAPAEKDSARLLVPAAARKVGRAGADVLVRINRPFRMAVKDLEACVCPEVMGFALPKTESADHLRMLSEVVGELEAERGIVPGSRVFIAMIETPAAFLRMAEIARADARVVAITVGPEDLSAACGMEADADSLYYPKVHSVLVARAAGVIPLGFVGSIADFADVEGFRDIVRRSRRLGFEGASAIHPNQVKVLNEVHRPGEAEVARAEAMIAAYDEARAKGLGAVTFEGRMIDVPIVERARRLVRRARAIAAREAKARAAAG
ncbi:MAG: CoA ester lyase [Proteobacteria bacterium]|nr:CoA ester lyase [Pseudomonadota bacterium]